MAHDLAEVVVEVQVLLVTLDDGVHRHQGEDGVVLVMCHQFTFAGQTHRVDAVRLEEDDGQVGGHRHNHQREEQAVAARQLSNEEDAGQGGVHHAAHHARHSQEREVVLGNEDAVAGEHVPQRGKQEARDAAHEQTGGEGSATSAAAVGGCGGEDLEDDDACQVQQQQVGCVVEERTLEHLVPVGLPLTVEQQADHAVTFAVERGEEEDEDAEDGTCYQQTLPGLANSAELIFKPVHDAGEVQRNQSTEYT